MKAVVINTSPDRERGQISALLSPFVDGLGAAGVEVELYYSRDMLIFPCCGNLNCTVRTPGKCMAWDDMRWLRQKIGEADFLVLASPLYYNGFTGIEGLTESTKQLLERLSQGEDAAGDRPYEHAIHTTREAVNLSKVVIISGYGFLEIDNFYPVLTHLKAFCYNTFPELAGSIGTERRGSVRYSLPDGASKPEIEETARTAGRQTAEDFRRQPRSPGEEARPGPGDTTTKKANVKREWSENTLFQFTCM